ncbi:hypothetical protein QJS04_geneDACA021743 [Acorus gramineus]|uniref:EF-hand domain-containing protein n=1 Tax=Acorus gramineus TaxID=55184 RepID=A0AAV9AG88_ACOGR|nr:hypothetical protein QJS04_geneDACA021743 [Acorus gramineus]
MTEEQFLKWLNDIDTNHDGMISKKELRKALHDLGLHFTRWRAGRAMARGDLNHNHFIDGDKEFEKLIAFAKNHWGIVN